MENVPLKHTQCCTYFRKWTEILLRNSSYRLYGKNPYTEIFNSVYGNQFLFIQSPHNFFVTVTNAINFVHSATMRSTGSWCNIGRLSTRFADHTSTPGNGYFSWEWTFLPLDIPPWTFPRHSCATGYDKKCKCCAGRRRTN